MLNYVHHDLIVLVRFPDYVRVLKLALLTLQILRCGPPPMNKAMAAHLDSLGYAPEMQFQF